MTIRALWFLSYLGVGLALAVGNRLDSPAEVGDSQEHPREKLDALSAAKTNLHLRAHQYDGSRRDVDHDWLSYDEQVPSGLAAPGLRASGNELRRYRDVFFDELKPVPISTLLPRRAPPREPLPFIYEEAIFQQQHHASKRPRGFKQTKKVVGLPPLVYGGSEEETPPGQSEPRERSNLDELFEQNSRSTAISFENLGGLPFEPPDSPHKPQGGGIGLSPLLFDTEKPPGKRTSSPVSGQGPVTQQFPAPPGGAAIASQFMLRSARGNRQYDVPQIGKYLKKFY